MLSPRALQELADRCLRSRQPLWTAFWGPRVWEDALRRMAGLEDLQHDLVGVSRTACGGKYVLPF